MEAQQRLDKVRTDDFTRSKMSAAQDNREAGPLQFLVDMVPSNIFKSFGDSLMLQVIFFALFLGMTMISLPADKVQGMVQFCSAGNEIFLKMVDLVMKAAPFFVFALMAGKLVEMAGDDPLHCWKFCGSGWYSITVVLGLALLVFVIYPLIVRLIHPQMATRVFSRTSARPSSWLFLPAAVQPRCLSPWKWSATI